MALLYRIGLMAAYSGMVNAMRMTTGKSKVETTAAVEEHLHTKYIEGVPVHNYHVAFQPERASSFLQAVKGDTSGDPLREHWVISLLDFVSDLQIEEACRQHPECRNSGHSGGVPFIEFQGSEEKLKGFLKERRSMIKFVEPDMPMFEVPEVLDPDAHGSLIQDGVAGEAGAVVWGLNRIGANGRRTTGKGVHVYVLDTGIRITHKDFRGHALLGFDATLMPPRACRPGDIVCSNDKRGHGTHCAGTVGSRTYGVAPDATIHAVKVLGNDGKGAASWTIIALDWVIESGQRPAVASMSLGSKGNSVSDRDAVDRAVKNGVVVVVAAGNEADDASKYSPAFVPAAITVGSIDKADSMSSFSNWGSSVKIFAPGTSITSASHETDTGSAIKSGTSMACPHVSGAAALLLESNPTWTSTEVLSALENTALADVVKGNIRGASNRLLRVDNLPGPGGVLATAPRNSSLAEGPRQA